MEKTANHKHWRIGLDSRKEGLRLCQTYQRKHLFFAMHGSLSVFSREYELGCNTKLYLPMLPNALVGLSSHDNGIALPLVAQTLGARVFEKTLYVEQDLKGTDHAFSLTPEALRKLIRDLQRARNSIGDGVKVPLPIEESAILKMGKKMVASGDLLAGTVLTQEHIKFKSPEMECFQIKCLKF